VLLSSVYLSKQYANPDQRTISMLTENNTNNETNKQFLVKYLEHKLKKDFFAKSICKINYARRILIVSQGLKFHAEQNQTAQQGILAYTCCLHLLYDTIR